MVASTGQLTGATVLILAFALVVEHPWTFPLPGWETGVAVAGMSLLSTALASIIYFRILASAGAAKLDAGDPAHAGHRFAAGRDGFG